MKKQYFLVEDHMLMRQGVVSYLSGQSDFECAGSAATPQEFFDFMEQGESREKIKLLITDLNINGTVDCGLSFIKECKSLFPEMKIAVYSMHSDIGIVGAAIESGAGAFVSKMSDASELKNALESLVGGRNYIEPNIARGLFFYERTLSMFSHRESDILRKILQGKQNSTIADELGITKRTVENCISKIYNKTGFSTKEELLEHFKDGV